ncbi:MAG: asparagine synthase-related protein [Phenylobacterium sp.]|uniref:asparagine synthetase B family protein n=1 Tax=Phenylobacterium sp. TaxID=1871053 RepID=UPI002718A5E6|nr:asparagine synthase-related protein [Phenylobacterium sp.]MDO9431823.1 asparagine synthase-related protein [Phenylobacterium sp.]
MPTATLPEALATGRPRFIDSGVAALARAEGDLAAWRSLLPGGAAQAARAARAAEGEFAVGLDDGKGGVFLAVDRFAIRSICYRIIDGRLHFAERADTLAALPPAAGIDPQAIFDYLYFHVVPSPRTIFKGVMRLPAGHCAWFEAGQLTVAPYWVPQFSEPASARFEPLAAEFRQLVQNAVAAQLDGGKAACFLSGGTDSSTVAGMIGAATGSPAATYSIGFEAEGYDEMAFARIAAKRFGCEHHEYYVTPDDLVRSIPAVAAHYDQPFGNSSVLPAFYCAQMAREDGVTRLLAGDGGDELFGGYGRYRRALRPAWLGGRAAEPRTPDAGVLARWREQAQAPHGLTRLQQAQWADIATWLPNDLLTKLDRCLMAHGLEGRTPFLDTQVADFAFPLPDRFKVRGRYGKWLLRKWLERACPAADPWARKQGFTVPVDAWIQPRAGEIGARIGQVAAVRRVLEPDAAAAVFATPSAARWPMLFFAVWSLIHLEGASPNEALAAVAG